MWKTQEMRINLWSEPSATLNARDSLEPPADNLHGSLVFKMSILIPGSHFYSTWKQNCRLQIAFSHTTFRLFPFLVFFFVQQEFIGMNLYLWTRVPAFALGIWHLWLLTNFRYEIWDFHFGGRLLYCAYSLLHIWVIDRGQS